MRRTSKKVFAGLVAELSRSDIYINNAHVTEEDIRMAKASLKVIFSNYSPGYIEMKALGHHGSLHQTSLAYFYNAFNIVSSLNNIEIDEAYSHSFIDIISCLIDCMEYDSIDRWKDVFIFYKLYELREDIFYLLGDVLFDTLRFVLMERDESEIIQSWKRIYWGILCRTRREICGRGRRNAAFVVAAAEH